MFKKTHCFGRKCRIGVGDRQKRIEICEFFERKRISSDRALVLIRL